MNTKPLPTSSLLHHLYVLLVIDYNTSVAKDAKPEPKLLTTNEAIQKAAATVLASGGSKAALGETLLLHASRRSRCTSPAHRRPTNRRRHHPRPQRCRHCRPLRQTPRHPRSRHRLPQNCITLALRPRHRRRRRHRRLDPAVRPETASTSIHDLHPSERRRYAARLR